MKSLLLSTILLFIFTATPVRAHDGAHEEDDQHSVGRVLGKIDFPTSTTSPEAQQAFIEGMLLLHLFEYTFAEAAFQKAQALDPALAMAYWGEAMVHNKPIWDQQSAEKARAVLAKFGPSPEARYAKLESSKARGFFESLDILYGFVGDTPRKGDRDAAYERHLGKMVEQYPDDHEIQLFYALALMGTHAGVRDTTAYMESAALSQRVFYANREHPGAAHYFIHGVDDPIHAPLGLEAARALYRMAPDAGHSLHMTSHIFTALGMWDDVVEANVNADRVADQMARERGKQPRSLGHYNFWLLYGLLQQDEIEAARTLLQAAYEDITQAGKKPAERIILDPDNDAMGSMVQMWARYMLETNGMDTSVATWTFDVEDAFDPNLNIAYVKGLLSDQSDRTGAHLSDFQALKAELTSILMSRDRVAPTDQLYLDRLTVMEQQLQSRLALLNGDDDEALSHAREASRLEGAMPYSFGPPFVDYPSAQFLGELAASLGNPEEAESAFSEQLKRSRNKRQAKAGLEQLTRQ